MKLTFWTPHGGAACARWELTASTYTQLHPQVTVETLTCGAGEQNVKEALLSRIAAGAPPDVAIVWETPVSYGVRGALTPLDDMMRRSQNSAVANWPAPVLASCQFGGKTYGFPTMVGVAGLYYNQDWFDRQGINSAKADFPRTWDELRKLSKQFTKWNGDKLETAGFIPSWTEAGAWPLWLALNGSRMFDPDGRRYTIDADANVATMEYALAWLDEEYKGDLTRVQRSAGWGMAPTRDGQPPAFQTQRLAAVIGGSWDMGDMYGTVPPQFEHWELAHFPHGPNGTKTAAAYWPNWFAIPTGTKVVQEAFNYIDWINGDGIKYWFATNPDIPPSKKFNRDLLPELVVQKRGREFTKGAMAYWYNQLDISTPMWTSPVEDFGIDQIARALERIMKKAAKPKEALAEAQKASQAELEKVLTANP
jgi:multiple sugar transport system substrate-binding protein